MAYNVRKVADACMFALVAERNLARQDAVSTTYFHLDRTNSAESTVDYRNPSFTRLTIATANASDSTTSYALANATKVALNIHFPDAIAHDTAVSAVIATPDATSTATAITLANAEKAAYNTHRTASNVHFNADSTNVVSSADATDAATLITLLNEMKGDINAHLTSAPAGAYINLVAP